MGTEEGLQELANHVDALAARVKSGEIPKSAMPRYFFIGHKVLNGFTGTEWFKCSCGHKWSISEGQCIDDFRENEKREYACPSCGKSEKPKNIHWFHEYNHNTRWQCLKCKHEWISENGEICPSCNTNYKDLCPKEPAKQPQS